MTNDPAFPQPMLHGVYGGMSFPGEYGPFAGLTVRAYIATKLAAALASSDRWRCRVDEEGTAKAAVKFADKLIAELSKP